MVPEMEGWTLFEALRYIHDNALSGRLHVYHWEGREGVIGINDGHIVHCHVGTLRGMEAFNVLRNWVSISLKFFEDVENLTVDIEEDTEAILDSLEAQDQEIKRFRRFVPNAQAVFELSPEGPEGNISLGPRIWKFLSMINGKNSVKDICRALGVTEFAVMKVLYLLAKRKVIRLVAMDEILPAGVRDSFIEEMQKLMAQSIGPIAPVVVEDTLREMGKSPDHITKNDLPLIVEKVSENIDDEGERMKFQSQMLALIQRISKGE